MTNATVFEIDPAICKKGGHVRGYLFPVFKDDEADWGGVRIPLYLFGLLYAFLGVGVAADAFMGAIEAITSKRVRKFVGGRWSTVYVWNATVANLSLMALGSSAPEILLNVLEISLGDFYAGDLGPSTIVGSAAFNMFCIIAVCVFAIDSSEVRKIKEMPVYCVTACFSIFAYLWLVVILSLSTPNIVQIWEAILTLLFFPILLVISYLADRGYIGGGSDNCNKKLVSHDMTKDELANVELEIRQKHGSNLTEDQVMRIIAAEYSRPPSRAAKRIAATRAMTGGKRVKIDEVAAGSENAQGHGKVNPVDASVGDEKVTAIPEGKACIEFEKAAVAVMENGSDLVLKVMRTGDAKVNATVKYYTREGTAKKDSDYVHKEGALTFATGETEQTITIKMLDDTEIEDNEEFYVDLVETDDGNAVLGSLKTCTCVIIDDDVAGTLKFPYKDDLMQIEEEIDHLDIEVTVERRFGSTGTIGCDYHTEDDSAVAGMDYVAAKGKIEMKSGEMSATIPITIRAHGRYERKESFRLILENPSGGAKFCEKTDGGDDHNILTIDILPGEKAKGRIDTMFSSMRVNFDKSKVGHANWKAQFIDALTINGGDDDEDEDEGKEGLKDGQDADGEKKEEKEGPSISDYINHFLALPWKLFFACIPPTDYCGGWITFFVALLGIGFVTLMISELASLLGCVMCMPDAITAITFVALGTSLPDTFASMSSAKEDPYADNSIGNVTGSNSVNVFLGLGLPWTMAAIYWAAKGEPEDKWMAMYGPNSKNKDVFQDWWKDDGYFVVIAGDLSISVVVFSVCAAMCIGTLSLRRKLFGGELGGPWGPKVATSVFFVSLWFIYVIVSSVLVVASGKADVC